MSLPVVLLVAWMQSAPAAPWPRGFPTAYDDLAYPDAALAQGLSGLVVVSVNTDAAGRVESAAVLRGPEVLARAVVENVKTWTLSPGIRDGAIVYRFEIDYGRCNDDRGGLFRIAQPNMAVITACSAPGRPVPTWPTEYYGVAGGKKPQYPPIAQSARVEGVVVLELTVGRSGNVEPRALTQLLFFTERALAHARQWRIRPPAPTRVIEVYEFLLDLHDCEPQTRSAFWFPRGGGVRLSACSPLINVGR